MTSGSTVSKPRVKKKHGKYKVGQLARWLSKADGMSWNILEHLDPRDPSGLPSVTGLTVQISIYSMKLNDIGKC